MNDKHERTNDLLLELAIFYETRGFIDDDVSNEKIQHCFNEFKQRIANGVTMVDLTVMVYQEFGRKPPISMKSKSPKSVHHNTLTPCTEYNPPANMMMVCTKCQKQMAFFDYMGTTAHHRPTVWFCGNKKCKCYRKFVY